LVADRLAGPLAQLFGNPPRRHSGRNPARFEYNNFTAHDRKERGRHSGRLPSARRGFDHKVRMTI
jgi:hypothetical protein